MTSKIVAYRTGTTDIALLFDQTAKVYFIGVYEQFLTHQNGEPPYCFIDGYWPEECLEQAMFSLNENDYSKEL